MFCYCQRAFSILWQPSRFSSTGLLPQNMPLSVDNHQPNTHSEIQVRKRQSLSSLTNVRPHMLLAPLFAIPVPPSSSPAIAQTKSFLNHQKSFPTEQYPPRSSFIHLRTQSRKRLSIRSMKRFLLQRPRREATLRTRARPMPEEALVMMMTCGSGG